MGRRGNMEERLFMGLCVSIVVTTLTSLPLPIAGLPVVNSSKNLSSFYDELYQNHTSLNCSLPVVRESDTNFTRFKINQFCGDTVGNLSSANAVLCQSLKDLFRGLCKFNNKTVPESVLKPIGLKVNLSSTCKTLVERRRAHGEQDKVNGFDKLFADVVSDGESKECLSLCHNRKESRETFKEYSDVQTHPVCILLLEAYQFRSPGMPQSKPNNVTAPTNTKVGMEPSDKPVPLEGPKIPSSIGNANKKNDESETAEKEALKDVVKKNNTVGPIPSWSPGRVSVGDSSKASTTNLTMTGELAKGSSSRPAGSNVEIGNSVISGPPQRGNNDQIKPPEQQANGVPSRSSTSSTTTTVASIDVRDPIDVVPIQSDRDTKVSKSSPVVSTSKPSIGLGAVDSTEESKSLAPMHVANPVEQGKKKPVSTFKKPKTNIDDIPKDVGDDDYSGEVVDKTAAEDIPLLPETSNLNDYDGPFGKSTSRFRGNAFAGEISEDRFSKNGGTPFSRNQTEDTGFFRYFLFSVILVGILYLIVHNKKRLVAYVVEGRRPRSRTRRLSASSGGQYKRLENNFD